MPPKRLFVVLLGFLAGLSPLAIDTYLPSLPAIARDLSAPPATVQLTVSVYLAFFGIPQLFFGPLSDAFGRRRVVLFGLGLYSLGALLCALAPNIGVLLAARALQATGSAATAVTLPALVKDRFSGADYTSTMGFIMMVMAMAPLVAPILGGGILAISGWRGIFFTLVVVALVCALLFRRLIPESLHSQHRVPFNWRQLMTNYGRLLSDRHCVALIFTGGFLFAALMAFITSSPFVYIEIYGVKPEYFGFLFGINVLGMMALTYLNNRLVYRFRNESLLAVSVGTVVTASIGMFILSAMEQPPLAAIIVVCAFFLANLGVTSANVMAILMTRFAAISGATAATVGTLRFGLAAVVGAVVSLLPAESSRPLTLVMGTCGLLVLLSFIVAGKTPPRQASNA